MLELRSASGLKHQPDATYEVPLGASNSLFNDDTSDSVGYSDADHARDWDSRKSTSGFVFVLHGGAISWRSKLQGLVTCSTLEAEFVAASEASNEMIWLDRLLKDLDKRLSAKRLYCDNQGQWSWHTMGISVISQSRLTLENTTSKTLSNEARSTFSIVEPNSWSQTYSRSLFLKTNIKSFQQQWAWTFDKKYSNR